jgi:hypothetical protein
MNTCSKDGKPCPMVGSVCAMQDLCLGESIRPPMNFIPVCPLNDSQCEHFAAEIEQWCIDCDRGHNKASADYNRMDEEDFAMKYQMYIIIVGSGLNQPTIGICLHEGAKVIPFAWYDFAGNEAWVYI